jgi:hypothetical protein
VSRLQTTTSKTTLILTISILKKEQKEEERMGQLIHLYCALMDKSEVGPLQHALPKIFCSKNKLIAKTYKIQSKEQTRLVNNTFRREERSDWYS